MWYQILTEMSLIPKLRTDKSWLESTRFKKYEIPLDRHWAYSVYDKNLLMKTSQIAKVIGSNLARHRSNQKSWIDVQSRSEYLCFLGWCSVTQICCAIFFSCLTRASKRTVQDWHLRGWNYRMLNINVSISIFDAVEQGLSYSQSCFCKRYMYRCRDINGYPFI